ncbi:hypothetical protein GLOIN_2v1777970 [Rhizophagus clarus]|uniref:Uncharacterized protein n=1 Tax=Rhizophagus clarus TaxID=94130 RepID=A0A8H3KQG2_9GLOM|nr:hypothetical protein GLOIN_2v1777970 [Rhizophagus clarus]
MYKLVSKRTACAHAYISFSKASKAGGNLFVHITPKQVIYHFDNNLDIIHTNSMVANLIGCLCLIENI